MGTAASIETGDPINDSVIRTELKDFFLDEVIKWKNHAGDEEDLKQIIETQLQKKETILRRQMSSASIRKMSTSDLSRDTSMRNAIREQEELDEKTNLVARKFRNLRSKFSHTFIVAVDGSQTADIAFQSVLSMRKNADNIVVYHSYSQTTEEKRPPEARLEPIKVKYEAALVSHVPTENYYMCIDDLDDLSVIQEYMKASAIDADASLAEGDIRQKALLKLLYLTEHQTTTMQHHSYFRDHIPDFVAFGFHGRKSELKEENKQLMGSAADHVLRKMHQPCMLFKRLVNPDRRCYLMAVDASHRCRTALYILQSLMLPRDKLLVVHVESSVVPLAEVKIYYEREVTRSCPADSQYVSLQRQEGEDIAATLLRYAYEVDPDFLVLVPEDHRSLDKIAETCLYTTRSNVLLLRSE